MRELVSNEVSLVGGAYRVVSVGQAIEQSANGAAHRMMDAERSMFPMRGAGYAGGYFGGSGAGNRNDIAYRFR